MKFNKIRLLKSIDKVAGPILVRAVSLIKGSAHSSVVPHKDLKILIIRPGGIGDAVLLIPAIKEIKRLLPRCQIDILAEKRNWEVFKMCKDVSNIYLYDRASELLKTLRQRYYIVIDTEQWHRLSAVVASLTGAPVRVGFSTNDRRALFTHLVSYSHEDYEVYSFFNLIKELFKLFDVEIPDKKLFFNPDSVFLELDEMDISDWVKQTITALIERFPSGYCVISPGATVAERRWGGENYAKVAYSLQKNGFGVVVVGTRADRADAEMILSKAGEALDLTGKTTLKEAAYVIKNARVFIGPDSGLLHIAFGLGTATVSLFGAGIESKWAPRGKKHVVINKRLPCSPCTRFGYTPRCIRDVRCLKRISPAEVLSSLSVMVHL